MKSRIIYSNSYLNNRNYLSLFKENFQNKINNFKNSFSFFKGRMQENELLIFIESICEFMRINNDLVFCLESSLHCVKGIANEKIRAVILMLKKGEVLSYALKEADVFPEYAVRTIKAGEGNKNFEETLILLKEIVKWNIEQKKKMKMAMMYPAFTFLAFVGVVALFSIYIVPSIFSLLNSLDQNCSTNIKIFSAFMFCLKFSIFSILGFIVGMYVLSIFDEKRYEKIMFSLPLFGKFLKYKTMYMTSYYMKSSLKNGVSITDSLNLTIDSSSPFVKDILFEIKQDVQKGVKLNESIRKFRFIPEIFANVIKTGENSGSLENSFAITEQMFFSKYQHLVDKMITLLPIVMILFTALMMIGFIMLVFMPLYNVGF